MAAVPTFETKLHAAARRRCRPRDRSACFRFRSLRSGSVGPFCFRCIDLRSDITGVPEPRGHLEGSLPRLKAGLSPGLNLRTRPRLGARVPTPRVLPGSPRLLTEDSRVRIGTRVSVSGGLRPSARPQVRTSRYRVWVSRTLCFRLRVFIQSLWFQEVLSFGLSGCDPSLRR